jgi:acyl carrier protein
MNNLVGELAQKIIDILGLFDVELEDINEKTTFFDDGLGIDSVDILELVVMLERDYGVLIDSRELGEKVFIDMGTLARYVGENRSAA